MRTRRPLEAETTVSRPWTEVRDRLQHEPWRLVQAATGSRTGLLMVHLAGFEVGRRVRIVLDPAVAERDHVRLHLEWAATTAAPLFPRMEADLVATPRNAGTVRLCFHGRYGPPAGAPGRLLDLVAGRRVASASLVGLMEGLARQLEIGAPIETHRSHRVADWTGTIAPYESSSAQHVSTPRQEVPTDVRAL